MSIIGKMTKSRGTWGTTKPVTKVIKSKKLYDRKAVKRKEKNTDD